MVRTTIRHTRPRRALLTWGVAASLAAATVGATAAPAGAHSGRGHHASSPTRVASGLDNPRQLTVTGRGDVYVAEAGRGGAGPCIAGPEGPACLGTSGAVTKVTRGHQSRVVGGLPSLAAPDGSRAIGPSDVVSLGGRKLAVLIGLGAPPAVRDGLPASAARLATLQQAREGSDHTSTIADLAAHEAMANPIHDPDSNPSSVERWGSRFVVTDAGGNDLLTTKHGMVSTTAVFQDQLAAAPPFLGLPPGTMIPAQAVPTAVVRGPDGAWYVSQLTGFPFPAGGANIYRVVPGHAPMVFASGLTNVTSLGFDSRGHLYAVQIADTGLLAAGEGLPSGSLVRVSRTGPHTVVADDLAAPYGLAIRDGAAYVSTCSVCPGGGEVWRFRL